MSQWKIDGARVQAITNFIAGEAESFSNGLSEDKFEELSNSLTGGATEGSATVNTVTGAVPGAVTELVNSLNHDLETISDPVQAGVLGVASATVEYNQGNEEMAATFQSQMVTAAQTGDFTFFEDNNVLSDG